MSRVIEAYKKGYRVTESGEVISPKGKVLVKLEDKKGYFRFGIKCEDVNYTVTINIHRLQAFQKYGMKLFRDGMEVRHKNGNKKDNSWENILIGTHSDNMMDIPEQVRLEKALHATSFCRKYDKEEVKEFYEENGKSYKKTMEKFNISSKGSLHYILNN
jgi:hypothetical protein